LLNFRDRDLVVSDGAAILLFQPQDIDFRAEQSLEIRFANAIGCDRDPPVLVEEANTRG
jgi:hypothetical protein